MINNELDKISEWLTVNQLSLNIPKTKFWIFCKKRKNIIPSEIKIQNIIIEGVFNFLGLILNENLSWKNQCDKISNSISKSVGDINRLKYYILKDIIIMLCNSIIVSHMNYCILKVEDILKLNELKFYYKLENELLHNYFKKTQEHNANIETEQKLKNKKSYSCYQYWQI